jgi:putative ABC transport system permease protein
MKFLHLVFLNLRRKKTRTALTLGSFLVALFLFGLLMTIKTALGSGVSVAGANRLVVRNRVSLIQPLPLSYREQMLRMPHITEATFATWFGGYYQDMKSFFPNYAIDVGTYLAVYPEYKIDEEDWRAFAADREGCVISPPLAKKFGWKIGDRIPLEASIWGGTWEFNVRAIYDSDVKEFITPEMWLHWDYLDERRAFFKGFVGWYILTIDDPANAVGVAAAIDERFANSPFESKTETEKAFAAGFANQIGNIRLLIMSIGSVVFFTLLLVTGNTMASAVRERTGEIGVLKTIGMSDPTVLFLVMAESIVVAAVGGGAGLALAKLFTLGGDPTRGMLPNFFLAGRSIALGFGLALAAGAAAGILPAVGAMRLKIVDALRRV